MMPIGITAADSIAVAGHKGNSYGFAPRLILYRKARFCGMNSLVTDCGEKLPMRYLCTDGYEAAVMQHRRRKGEFYETV